jgi:hypothetical protein
MEVMLKNASMKASVIAATCKISPQSVPRRIRGNYVNQYSHEASQLQW